LNTRIGTLVGAKLARVAPMGKKLDRPSNGELATLLARGYLRLLATGRPGAEIAPISSTRESSAGSPNCLDVAGRAKHELDEPRRNSFADGASGASSHAQDRGGRGNGPADRK